MLEEPARLLAILEPRIDLSGTLRVEVAKQVWCLSIEKVDTLLPAFAFYARFHPAIH
jgi:hypothetical protein